nr:nodulation protein [Melilotus officinalis]
MKDTLDFAMFQFLRRLFHFSILISFFMIMFCSGGELLSSESHSFFSFLKAIDSNNVLNISKISHPCLINGVRCNSNATNIVEIKLDNMNLSGIFDADSLCRLQKLKVVSLANNNIKGTISTSILHCTRLVYLNVSNNQLSCRLPNKALTRLKYLKNLDVSINNFSFSYMAPISNKLESKSDIDTIQPTPSPLIKNTNENANKPLYSKIEILVGSILGIGLLLLSLYFMVKKLSKLMGESEVKENHLDSPIKKATSEGRLKGGENNSELVFFVEDHERFKLEDLLRATADLRGENFWSSLFKVKFENNVEYAVKRLKNLQVSCDEFGETLKKISKVKHQNILPLVGYRSRSEEKLIIYKYQSNGSLLNLLNDYIARRKDFPWKLRLNIACGIARGLAFIYKKLNEGEVDSIPHGNLKLSNILLDDKNEALISEHGLSKFFEPSRGGTLFSTHGYTAPEKSLTEKGDVYSFGVILLELLTGQSIEVSRIDLVRWVRSMVREEWTGEVFDKEVRENDHQGAFSLLNIALMCVSRSQENRPNVREILETIEGVMNSHDQQQMELSASKCCSNGSNQECCSLHQIIPDTWDSPGSNY